MNRLAYWLLPLLLGGGAPAGVRAQAPRIRVGPDRGVELVNACLVQLSPELLPDS